MGNSEIIIFVFNNQIRLIYNELHAIMIFAKKIIKSNNNYINNTSK